MKISRKQLSLIIESYLLTEAVHDKVAAQLGITDPDKIDQLRIASEKPHKLQKPELLWIGKYYTTSEGMQTKEPIADIVAAIKSLKQNKSALIRRGSATGLSDYESPGQINIAVSLSRGFVDISQLSEQVDVLYEDEDWTLYMPYTREASCTIGRGTAWCTAIAGSGNNLFYNYVISGRAILYYLVKKKKEENEGPATTHFSLGTVGGRISFPAEGQGNGGIVVDGSNRGISKTRFLSLVGNQLGNQLMTAIEQHSQQNRNKHPAKNKVREMLNNPALYGVEMRGKSIDIRYDFTGMMTSIYKDIFEGEEPELDNLIADVFTNPNNTFHDLIAKATEIKQKDIDAYEAAIQSKNGEVLQRYGKVFGDGETIKEAEYVIRKRSNDASLDISGASSYRFCKNLDKLSGAIPYYYYQMVEKMALDTANAWQSEEPDEDYVIEMDEEVTPNISYTFESDPTASGIERYSMLDKYFDEFIGMLGVYHANILMGQGYCIVHDPERHNNTGQLRHENAGLPVAYVEDFLELVGDTDNPMWWTNEQYPEYEYSTSFTGNKIQNYMRSNFSQEFVDWCDLNGFTFTYDE